MPTYDNMIPQPTDILSDSQDDILENFQQLATAFAVNHGPYNSGNPPQGTHTQVTLPNNAAPTPTAIATANVWSAQSANTGQTELYWQKENNGRTIAITDYVPANNGWTNFPSGIKIQWGQASANGNNQLITLPVPPSATGTFTTVYAVFVTTQSATGNTSQVTYVTNSFNATAYPTPQTFNVNCYSLSGAPSLTFFQFLIVGI